MTLGGARSDMVIGLKDQRSRLGLGYSNTAWVRTLYECLLLSVLLLAENLQVSISFALIGRCSDNAEQSKSNQIKNTFTKRQANFFKVFPKTYCLFIYAM